MFPRLGLLALFVWITGCLLALGLIRIADTAHWIGSSQGLVFAIGVLMFAACCGAPIGHVINRHCGWIVGAIFGMLLVPLFAFGLFLVALSRI